MNKIYVATQEEFDMIPLDYEGRIIIKLAYYNSNRVLKIKNDYPNAMIEARDLAKVGVYGAARVSAYDHAWVYVMDKALVYAHDRARVEAYDHATVFAYDSAWVFAYNSALVFTKDWAMVFTYDEAKVYYGTTDRKIIDGYIKHYGVESVGNTCRLYKAVHKIGGKYMADWKAFEYKIGETAIADGLDTDASMLCGKGIHLSHLAYAIEFGRGWNDLAILELEAEKDQIIVPIGNPDKVRTFKAKVIREVPRDEWKELEEIIKFRWKPLNFITIDDVNDISDVNT